MRLLVIAPGRVGTVICRAAAAAGIQVGAWSRAGLPESRRALLDAAGVSQHQGFSLDFAPDLVVVATADRGLEQMPDLLDRLSLHGVPAVHCSGSREARVLADGARATGRMHPAFPIPTPDLDPRALTRAVFVLEGDEGALEPAEELVRRLGATPVRAPAMDRLLYHAGCVTAANFLVVLAQASVRMMTAAGLEPEDAWAAALGLMEQSLRNCDELGFASGLTGPASRGDWETIQGHLTALARKEPDLVPMYQALTALIRTPESGN